ncbi:hypothetical protein JNW90_13730 [Micromonospora sp. STR1s_5]|nr:hypothetical protein [Micromonospora sp. STR1s_5]
MPVSVLHNNVTPEFFYDYDHNLTWEHPIPIALAQAGLEAQYVALTKAFGPEGKSWMVSERTFRNMRVHSKTEEMHARIAVLCDEVAEAVMRKDFARLRPKVVILDDGRESIAIPISQDDIERGIRPELDLDGLTDLHKERVAQLMDGVFAPGGFTQRPAPEHIIKEIGKKAFGLSPKPSKPRRRRF